MDFNRSEEQIALAELAREIFENELTLDRLKEIDGRADWFDRELWARLAEANLLGLAVPETLGGMGMGFLEVCILLEEMGRALAPVPALHTLVCAGLPIAHFGTDAQQERWLRPLARGEVVMAGAFREDDSVGARHADGVWILDGLVRAVPCVPLAQRIVVPARSESGEALFLVDPSSQGVLLVRQQTSRREPVFEVSLAGARVPEEDVLGGVGIGQWTRERATVAIAATQIGVSQRSLEITTEYVKEREQFGGPLGALPAVQHRCADCYIALDSMRWATWYAAWRLADGRDASRDAMVAKFWAAEAGSQIANATQHLHGGMGVDLDYPIHRYFLWSKSLELALGSAMPQLVKLGRDMARTGPQELS